MLSKSQKNLILWAVVILIAITSIGSYNSLVSKSEDVNAAWAQVENQLQRRFDLIPNLVNVVKGYAKHEEKVFGQIAAARASVGNAQTFNDKVNAAGQMESAVGRLLVVVENYPNLKSDANFTRLMDELAGTENRVAQARRIYNLDVQEYNRKIKGFPGKFFANLFGFSEKPYFQVEDKAKTAPEVKF